MPRLWMLPVLGLIAVLGFACGDSGDDKPQSVSSTAPAASVAATPSASASPTAIATPAPVPSGWTTYTDPQLGFSVAYPPDLVFKEVIGPTPLGGQLAIEFRSASDPERGFGVTIIDNPAGASLEKWTAEFSGCLTDTIQSATVAGWVSLTCTAEVLEGSPEWAAIVPYEDKMLRIVAGKAKFTDSEFAAMIASFRFRVGS